MKILYNRFFKVLCKISLSICLVILIFGTLLADFYNNRGQFNKTYIANSFALTQVDKIMSYSIIPYFEDGISMEELDSHNKIFEDIDFLDENYHFIVKSYDEVVYSDITDKSTVAYISEVTHEFSNDYGSNEYLEITIESYVNKNLIKEGELYEASLIFNKLNNNINEISIFLCITAVIAIFLIAHTLLTAGYNKDGIIEATRIDKIYIEILFIIYFMSTEIIYIEGTTITSYISIIISLLKLFYLVSTSLLLVTTIVSRIRNKIFMKRSLIVSMLTFFKKITKQILEDLSSKVKATLLVVGIFLIEIFILFNGIFTIELSILQWLLFKVAEFLLLMHFYSNVFKIKNAAKDIHDGSSDVKIDTSDMHGITRETAEYMNDIFTGLDKAVAEKLKSEQLKTELITNVSHDLKTPLTSIINYVDLMKKEDTDNPKLKEYLEVIDKQSMRLKKLTEDVIEASKAATGNIKAELNEINISEMMSQALGEYENKFNDRQLSVIFDSSENQYFALADGRLLWRVIDNLFSNVCKYALEGTRLYIDIDETGNYVIITVKNISKYQLNISSEELMQRFVRGDSSRSTSGNGLGLSIAESLMALQNGKLKLDINGDLFTANIYLTEP